MGELGLIGASTTESHPTPFTTGYRSSIRQRHRRMVTIPPNHQSPRGSSILETPSQQGRLLISGVKPYRRKPACQWLHPIPPKLAPNSRFRGENSPPRHTVSLRPDGSVSSALREQTCVGTLTTELRTTKLCGAHHVSCQ